MCVDEVVDPGFDPDMPEWPREAMAECRVSELDMLVFNISCAINWQRMVGDGDDRQADRVRIIGRDLYQLQSEVVAELKKACKKFSQDIPKAAIAGLEMTGRLALLEM